MYVPFDLDEKIKKECKRRRYSPRTVETYLHCIHKFLNWSGKDLRYISKKDVCEFLEHLSEKERAGNTLNVYHMALRFLFEDVLDKKMWINIKYSKTPEKLPVVLTKEEVKNLFNSIKNGKHRLMIELMYSAGLRVSELLNLKICDINLEKYFGFVRHGKGNKDRIFVLSEKLRWKIEHLIEVENLTQDDLLFLNNRREKYSARTVQQIIKNAVKKSGIKKKVHPHTLRHSFATHLIENGYSLNEVQTMLGHKSPETSMIYVHLATPNMINIKSPFDSL